MRKGVYELGQLKIYKDQTKGLAGIIRVKEDGLVHFFMPRGDGTYSYMFSYNRTKVRGDGRRNNKPTV